VDLAHQILDWVASYGYLAILGLLVLGIVGLPVPDETLLTFAGYLASRGELRLPFTLLCGFLGASAGITLSYLIGRSAGSFLVRRFGRRLHLTPERMQRVHGWFEHLGRWTLTLGFFIPGVRHLTALAAGSSRMRYPEFALFAYAGAAVWSACFVLAGYFFGHEWSRLGAAAHRAALLVAAALAVAGGLYWLWRRQRRRRRGLSAA